MSIEYITGLIELYRKHVCLWNPSDKSYTNKNINHNALMELVEYSKKYHADADKNFVQKKIQNLRTAFRKEFNKVKNSKKNGSGTEDVYTPTLWYYDLLLFITYIETPVRNLETIQDDTIALDSEATEVFRNPDTALRKRKIQELASNSKNNQKQIDEFDAVAIVWSSKLRKLSETQKVLAEDLINQILKKAYFNKLTEDTQITTVGTQSSSSSIISWSSESSFSSSDSLSLVGNENEINVDLVEETLFQEDKKELSQTSKFFRNYNNIE